jgi:periplasmic protein CpxP/Spy
MHKNLTRMGLGLALVVGAATAAAAQSQQPNARPDTTQRDHRRWDGERGGRRGGPDGALLRGITLTDAQKTRLQALRKQQEPEMKKNREQFRAVMKEAREARERGDTTTARAKMTQVRSEMDRQRERQIAALRPILTPEQQKQLDANVAAWKERAAQGGHRDHGDKARPGGVGR